MSRPYSILLLRGTRVNKLAVLPSDLRLLLLAFVMLLCWSAWYFNSYIASERQKLRAVISRARAQQEVLSALQERTKEVQETLSRWEAYDKKIRASLPRRHSAASPHQLKGERLRVLLESLQQELKEMISSLPSDWPVRGHVVSGVGMRPSPWTGALEFHSGLDIPKPVGTPVHAPGDAIVESIERSKRKGETVLLNHGQEIKTRYAHLSKILVNEGERVRRGQPIGQVGNTGKSTGPHLHYEVLIRGTAIDPRKSLIGVTAGEW